MTLAKIVSLVSLIFTGLFAVNEAAYFTSSNKKESLTKEYSSLNNKEMDAFILGKSFFNVPWVEAPSATTARDGLGPLFNANTCIHCHPNNALGSVYNKKGDVSRSMVVRLSMASNNSKEEKAIQKKLGFIPHPVYGAQVSINGLGDVPYEGKLTITYTHKKIQYPDGTTIILRKPNNKLTHLNYGKLGENVSVSVRKAPPLVGLGLLEEISSEDILQNADENDANQDGISGRANLVYSVEHNDYRLGRYTYKASVPTIKHQIAAALHNDMGLTTTLFERQNCSSSQAACNESPKARDAIDVPDMRLDAMTFYLTHLKVPVSNIKVPEGEKLFKQIGCSSCHIPAFKTKKGIIAKPYSDFLLHDMGEALSDNRSEFKATSQEWKTAPLWGINSFEQAIGKSVDYLHDGRARSLEEAILWHGGEAQTSKELFMQLTKDQRELVIKFLGTL